MEYAIEKYLGRIETNKGNVVELNLVSVNGGKELFDIGRWNTDGRRVNGVFFEREQLAELRDHINRVLQD